MPRATNSPASRKRRKRVLKRAKGFRGFRSKLYKYAKDAVRKAQSYEYRDRKKRKGQFRRLWIQRISAGVRAQDLTYSRFVEGLKAANIEVDRKILADLAVHDIDAFNSIVAQSKAALEQKAPATA
jgi:large subunit ribosomal protein L20